MTPTAEEIGMARGGLWFIDLVSRDLLENDPIVHVSEQKCMDTLALAEEHGVNEDDEVHRIAFEMLIGCLDAELQDFDAAVEAAAHYISYFVVGP